MAKFSIPTPNDGILREAAIDQILVPSNTIEEAINLHFDAIGAVTLRQGLTIIGAQVELGSPILGMANYVNNAGDTYRLLAKVNTSVYAYNGSSWSSVRSGITASSKARFTNFLDLTYMVNGKEAVQTYDGSTFGTTNVASLPTAADTVENYRSRIWAGDSATDKLHYTDVVTTSQTITGGTSFIQVAPQDGEKLRALKKHPRALLAFKDNHIYRIFSTSTADPDPSHFRGTFSQESVIEDKGGISYHHPSGFYEFVFDGQQREISRAIIDIVQAIPRSYYADVSGWVDDNHRYWSVGDITLGGIDFTNVVCRYTVSTQVWTVYSYGSEIRSAVIYDAGTTRVVAVGDDVGNVLTFDSGTTDNGTSIFYSLITHWLYFTELKSTYKTLTEITTLHEKANGGNLSYQIDSDRTNIWRPIGQLSQDISQVNSLNATNFRRIRFRFHGNSSGSIFQFRGWEPLNMIVTGETK